MATYTKETALYDTGAISGDIDDASTKATAFLAADSSGIMVYDGSNGVQTPSDPAANTNNVFIDSDSLDVRRGTNVLATFGSSNARIGANGKASIYMSPDTLIGYGEGGSEFFNFSNSQASLEVTKTEVIANNVPFTQIPSTDANGYSVTLPYAPKSGTTLSAEFGLIRAATGVRYTFWFVSFTAGTAATKQASYAYNGNTYVVSATYDGNKTISKFKMTPQSTDTSLYSDVVEVYYRTDALTPCYEIGGDLTASGAYAFAHGSTNTASGNYSHAGGFHCTASGTYSYAEGYYAQATNQSSRSEGYATVASGLYSRATGAETTASGHYQTVIGRKNVADTTSLFIIGNGTVGGTASNALTVSADGYVTMNNGAFLRLNHGTGSSYSWNQIWSNTAAQSGHSDTSNLYLQADGYIGFYVGNDTTAPTGRMYLFYDYLQVSGYITASGGYRSPNATWYYMGNSGGKPRQLAGINSSNQYFFGYGSYNNSEGASYFDGNSVTIRTKNTVSVTGGNFVVDSNRIKNKYAYTNTTTYQTNVYINSDGYYNRTTNTSSKRYKHDIKDVVNKELDPHHLYDIEVKQFKYNKDVVTDKEDCRYDKDLIGFISEQVKEHYPIAVDINEKGECEAWHQQYIIPPMLALIQEQHRDIELLKTEIKALKERRAS